MDRPSGYDSRESKVGRVPGRLLMGLTLDGQAGMVDGKKVFATGGWTFIVEPQFELLDNGDSVQAVHGNRIVYISSLRVGGPECPVPAAQLRATAATRMVWYGKHFAHVGDSVQGDADVFADGDKWCLHGIMCADGSVATCTINFCDPAEQAWAVAVWKSLACTQEPHNPPM